MKTIINISTAATTMHAYYDINDLIMIEITSSNHRVLEFIEINASTKLADMAKNSFVVFQTTKIGLDTLITSITNDAIDETY